MSNVKTITIGQLDRLGVDGQNRLYWDGKPLVTEERIVLARWVNVSVVVGSASTLLVAVVEVLRFLGLGVR